MDETERHFLAGWKAACRSLKEGENIELAERQAEAYTRNQAILKDDRMRDFVAGMAIKKPSKGVGQ